MDINTILNEMEKGTPKKPKKKIGAGKIFTYGTLGIVGFIGLGIVGGSWYTVDVGERALVKRFGEVVHTADPGLHFKVPFIDGTVKIEVRTRKAVVSQMATSTIDQLPSTAAVSVNWTVNADAVDDLYTQYGGLDTFESRVLYPRIQSAAKIAIAKYTAEEVNRNRGVIVGEMLDTLRTQLGDFPITINSLQLEDIKFPQNYIEAIEKKQTALQQAKEEEHKLEQQRLKAQQAVNTAQAEAESLKLAADAEAYAVKVAAEAAAEKIRLEGAAEAEKLELIAKALSENPQLVDKILAENWDGKLPRIIMGDDGNFLLDFDSLDKQADK